MKKVVIGMVMLGSMLQAQHILQLSYVPLIKRAVATDATPDLNNAEQSTEEHSVKQLFIDLEEIHDNLSLIVDSNEEAEIIITRLTQLIIAMIEAAAEISVIGLESEMDELLALQARRSPVPFEMTTPTQQPTVSNRQSKIQQIVLATITEIASNIVTIVGARKNPRILGPTIATMIAKIVHIISAKQQP